MSSLGSLGDQVGDLPFQFGDIHCQFRRPIIGAIPLNGILFALKALVEIVSGVFWIVAVLLGIARRQVLHPEVVIKMQVEQGAVHVQQNGVDGAPVDHG